MLKWRSCQPLRAYKEGSPGPHIPVPHFSGSALPGALVFFSIEYRLSVSAALLSFSACFLSHLSHVGFCQPLSVHVHLMPFNLHYKLVLSA